MTQYQADADDLTARDRDRGDTRSTDYSCDEAEYGVCGDEDTEQCSTCGRWVCEEHQADHAAEHREIAEALLQSQHSAKAAKQAEVDRLYREARKGAA
jgi:hypothetical protein